jgi:proline iminopeptidase
MMMSASSYNEYTRKVLMPKKDQKALEQDTQHILRMPADQWPDPVNRALSRMNKQIYVAMRGPSEMGLGGTLAKWDRTADLGQITVPTLVIGATHDTMDPKHMEWVSKQVKNGQYLHCPNGSHLSMYDDQETYFGGLIRFLTSTSGSAGK